MPHGHSCHKYTMANVGRFVARSSSFFNSVWSSDNSPHPRADSLLSVLKTYQKMRNHEKARKNSCEPLLIRLRSAFKVPDRPSATIGGSINTIVDNIFSRVSNLQLIIMMFRPSSNPMTRIEAFSVAI